jgi:tetratricopeptide (TPR) repeat protein
MSGCSSREERQMKLAQDEASKGNFRIALTHLDKIILRTENDTASIDALRDAARISFFEVKDFNRAIEYNRKIVLLAKDPEERKQAQKQIAEIYFTQLNDYSKSIVEINKLLVMLNDPVEKSKYQLSVARAYYYQNNFALAENEADEFLRNTKDEKQRFDLIMLKGNIALAQKNLLKAIEVFKGILKEFPKLAQKDNVALTLAVCYEETKDYKNAITTLELLKASHPVPEYIDIRIRRLRDRMKNAPGAKGMRK